MSKRNVESQSWIIDERSPERWTSNESIATPRQITHRHTVHVDHFTTDSEDLLPPKPASKRKKRRNTYPNELRAPRVQEERIKQYQQTLDRIKTRGFSISNPPQYLASPSDYPLIFKPGKSSKLSEKRSPVNKIKEEDTNNEKDVQIESPHGSYSYYIHKLYHKPLNAFLAKHPMKNPLKVPPQPDKQQPTDFAAAAILDKNEQIQQRKGLQKSIIVCMMFCLPSTFVVVIVVLLILLF